METRRNRGTKYVNSQKKVQTYSSRTMRWGCLLYTSDAADERSSVDLGGRRIIKKKNTKKKNKKRKIKTKRTNHQPYCSYDQINTLHRRSYIAQQKQQTYQ